MALPKLWADVPVGWALESDCAGGTVTGELNEIRREVERGEDGWIVAALVELTAVPGVA